MTYFSQVEWAKTLKKGQKVLTRYITDFELREQLAGASLGVEFRECTVEYVMLDASYQAGVLIKLQEFADLLDASWIIPHKKDDLFKACQLSQPSKVVPMLTPTYQAVIEVGPSFLCIYLIDVKIGEKLAFPDEYEDQLKIYQTSDKRWIVDFFPVFDRNDLVEYIEEQLRSFGLTRIKVTDQ